jgi:hypothetical protein
MGILGMLSFVLKAPTEKKKQQQIMARATTTEPRIPNEFSRTTIFGLKDSINGT